MSSLEGSYDITLEGFGDALALKDAETEGHSKRVTALTIAIARAMGLPREQINTIARGAFLHDIGKMKEHPYHGYQIVKKIPFQVQRFRLSAWSQGRTDSPWSKNCGRGEHAGC